MCAGHRGNGSRPGWQVLAEVTSGKGRDMGKEDLVGPVLHQWGRKLLLNPKTGFLNLPLHKEEQSTFIKSCVSPQISYKISILIQIEPEPEGSKTHEK